MFNPRAFIKLAAFGLASLLFGGNALMAQISVGPDDLQGGGGSISSLSTASKAKIHADDPTARIDWWRQRLGGDLTPDFMARVMREAELQRFLYPEQFQSGSVADVTLPEGIPLPLASSWTTWTNLGPTKSNKIQNGIQLTAVNSGRLRTILPDPTDPNILYVLTSGGGLWKTNDLLSSPPTWRFLSDRVGSTMGGAVAFGNINSGASTVLYLGLGDAFDLGVGGFIVKTTDAGSTWSSGIQLTGTVGATTYTATKVLDLKVNPGTPDIILVGTDAGLFRSTNGGTSYSIVNNASFNGKYVWSLIRTGATTWVASVEDYSVGNGTGSLLRSLDDGATWSAVATPPTGVGRMTLAVAVPGESTAYCFAANTGDAAQKDLYYSTNGGNTWTACAITAKTPTNSNGDQGNMDLMAGQAFYNHLILVDPTDATRNTVYLGGQLSSARSSNAMAPATGSTWTLMTNWLPGGAAGTAALPYAHADFHCAAFTNAGGTPRLLLGNDGGLAIGTGATWNTWDHSKNVGIVSHLIYALDSGPLNNCDANSVLMGLQDNGTHNRIGGTSVFDQTYGGDGFGVGWSQATNAASLGSYVYNQIYRCTTNPPDDQTKWANFVTGLGTLSSASYYFVTPIITAPGGADSTGNVFYTYGNSANGANSGKIFRSNAAGWTAIGTHNVGGFGNTTRIRAVSHGIGAHPTDPNRIAAAGTGGIVLITINGGTAWTERNLMTLVSPVGPRTWQGYNANVEWVDNSILFATSESTLINSIHVAKSTNGGLAWAAAEIGLPDLPVVKIVCDRGDATGNTLYAATWLGVYRTLDGGTSWSLFGSGLPQSLVTDLYIHPTSSFLRASIWGRGIWQVGPTPTYSTPTFSTQPSGASFVSPAGFSLSATVSNTYPTVSYQWRRNGVNLANGGGISGATTATLTLSSTTCSSGGDYTLAATNCVGTTISDAATMTSTVAAPLITSQPANTRVSRGATYALKVVATGAATYQWRLGGANLTNTGIHSTVTTANLNITNDTRATGTYTYDCVVTNAGGCSVTSNAALVRRGSDVPPNIVKNPSDLVVTAPTGATFSFTAGGGGANRSIVLTFQWRKNGVNLTNAAPNTWTPTITVNANSAGVQPAATSVLTITSTTDTSAGIFDCVVTTVGGSVTCAGARLTVNRQYTPATAVSIASSVPTAAFGTPVTFTAGGSGALINGTATPAPPSAYQYQFWVYLDEALGWTMVQDYSTANTFVMPGTTQPGDYGIGVDCRTSPAVLWDVFNSIDYFTITPIAHGPAVPRSNNPPPLSNRPKFNGGHTSINSH